MIRSLTDSQESYKTPASFSPEYLIFNFNYDIVRVEELLYEIDSSITHKMLLSVAVDLIRSDKSVKECYAFFSKYFYAIQRFNNLDGFENEFKELRNIFIRFVLEFKLNGYLQDYLSNTTNTWMTNEGMSSIIIADRNNVKHFKRRQFTEICNPWDRSSLAGIEQDPDCPAS